MLYLIKKYVIHLVIHHLRIDMCKQSIRVTRKSISSIL